MVKVASVYKDLICERPAGLCKDIDVQEYATAQDMIESTCIKVGYAHTLGFYEVGDGGAAYYTVGGEGEPNGMDVLQCRKGLVAELVCNGYIIIEQLGGIKNLERAIQISDNVLLPNQYETINISAQNKTFKINKCESIIISSLEGCKISINEIDGYNCLLFNPTGDSIGTRIANNLITFNTIYTSNIGVYIQCSNGSFFNNTIEGELIRGNNNTIGINTITSNLQTTYANSNDINIKSIASHNIGFKVNAYQGNCYSNNIEAAFENCVNSIDVENATYINYILNNTEHSSGICDITARDTSIVVEFKGIKRIEDIQLNIINSYVDMHGTFINSVGNLISNHIYFKGGTWFYTPYLNDTSANINIGNNTIYNDGGVMIQGSGTLTLDCATPNGFKIIAVRTSTSKQSLNLTINNISTTIELNNYPSFVIVSIINGLVYAVI